MKIQRIETFCTREVGFVRVSSEEGAHGWGVEINPRWLEQAEYQVSEAE